MYNNLSINTFINFVQSYKVKKCFFTVARKRATKACFTSISEGVYYSYHIYRGEWVMYVKKWVGHVLSSYEMEKMYSGSQCVSNKKATTSIHSPPSENVKPTSVGLNDPHTVNFFNYLVLKSVEHMGYHKFLYISELLTNTCDDCEGKHGSLFTIKDVEQGVISLPLHRNCKCTLIAIDQTSEIEYNLDRGLFLKWVMKQAQKLNGGIYKLEDGIVAPVVEYEQPKISSGLPQQSWLDRLKKWADEFSDDASAAWDSVLAASMKRAEDRKKSIPNFLDWITAGIVSGYVNATAERVTAMQNSPSLFTISDWLLSGVPSTINETFNPEKPLSFEHWLNSLTLAGEVYAGYEIARHILPVKHPNSSVHDILLADELTSKGIKCDVDEVLVISKTPDGKILWLETGSVEKNAGLAHIMDTHGVDFINKEIYDVPKFIKELIETQPLKTVIEPRGLKSFYSINGSGYRLAYGTNGFIVNCFPDSGKN